MVDAGKGVWKTRLGFRLHPLQTLLIVVITAGIFFRFVNLDQKVFWGDETLTIVRTSGYSVIRSARMLAQRGEFTAADVLRYQQVSPEAELEDIVRDFKGRARPPLYYLLVHDWRQWLGDSVAILRSFSALTGLISIGLTYWLAWELFLSPVTAALAAALTSVSPVHVLYAQEAREYSLLTAAILFSGAALLRAVRRGNWGDWGLYAIATTLGLYIQWLFVFVLASHSLFIFINTRWREWQPKLWFVLATSIPGLLFSIWLVYAEFQLSATLGEASWSRRGNNVLALIASWILNISRVFFDLNQALKLPSLLICFAVFALVLVCFYCFGRQASQQARLFVFSLIGVTAAALILPDLIDGGRGSVAIRYAFPCVIGVQLVVAFAISNGLHRSAISSTRSRQFISIIAAGLLGLGLISCAVSAQADYWWSKYSGKSVLALANVINNSENSLLLTNTRGILTLSHHLLPSTPIYWLTQERVAMENLGYTYPLSIYKTIFWYAGSGKPSQKLLSFFENSKTFLISTEINEEYQIEPTFSTKASLYRLVLTDANSNTASLDEDQVSSTH